MLKYFNMNSTPSLYDPRTGLRLYTVREAARLLGYHPFSIYRLACRGALSHTRLGPKTLLFSREDLLRYRERFERDKPRRGRPLPAARPGPELSARVDVRLKGRDGPVGAWRQFRWEYVPLIRARMDSRYGERLQGLRISVRGREGEAWKVIYAKGGS